MTRRQDHINELVAVLPRGEDAIRTYLSANSGLPGPRGNLELAEAWADVGPEPVIWALADDDDEYLRFCGVVGKGRLLAEALAGEAADRASVLTAALHEHATDASWRVREATAMALQRVGDREPAALRALVDTWAADPHPLVQRAAIAGVCEPRLLVDPATAAAALEACATTTRHLAARPAAERRTADVRTLRQALGYCWSVAIAADPERGLPAFRGLENDYPGDGDVAWIVRENLRKKRLIRVLDAQEPEAQV